jgi:hypothetical protein
VDRPTDPTAAEELKYSHNKAQWHRHPNNNEVVLKLDFATVFGVVGTQDLQVMCQLKFGKTPWKMAVSPLSFFCTNAEC